MALLRNPRGLCWDSSAEASHSLHTASFLTADTISIIGLPGHSAQLAGLLVAPCLQGTLGMFQATQERSKSNMLLCGKCCLPKLQRPEKSCASFFVVEGMSFVLSFGGDFPVQAGYRIFRASAKWKCRVGKSLDPFHASTIPTHRRWVTPQGISASRPGHAGCLNWESPHRAESKLMTNSKTSHYS